MAWRAHIFRAGRAYQERRDTLDSGTWRIEKIFCGQRRIFRFVAVRRYSVRASQQADNNSVISNERSLADNRGYAPARAKAMLPLKHQWRERSPLRIGAPTLQNLSFDCCSSLLLRLILVHCLTGTLVCQRVRLGNSVESFNIS